MISFELEDRVCVVTGGTSGIGLAAAELFLQCGAKVAICGRDEARLKTAMAQLAKAHGEARLYGQRCDVLDEAQVQSFVKTVQARLGDAAVLVNNAGQGRMPRFDDTNDARWREELELKFFSIIRPTRAFLPQLERTGIGSIVCVNAMLAKQPETYMAATSAARAGVLNLAHTLGHEYAPHGVRVNSILIGSVESGHFEAARAILFLASPLSSYTTASTIDVSGGHTRHV